MITVREAEIKSNVLEYTLGEFEVLSKILNNEDLEYIDKYLEIFRRLGIDESVINDLDDNEFFEIVKSLNEKIDIPKEMIKSIEIKGYMYSAYSGDEFKLMIKDLSKIENCIKSGKDYLTEAIAIIFKRDDLSSTEHYIKEHIEYKKSLFKELPVAQFMPYIVYIAEKMALKVKMISNNE